MSHHYGNIRSRPPGYTEATALLLTVVLAFVFALYVIAMHYSPNAVVVVGYVLAILAVPSVILAIRLCRHGAARVPPLLGTIGIVYIVGGALFDLIATIIHTPSLENEANIIARAFLDSGHSVGFVYGYAVIAQSLLIILISTLWLSLLTHRMTLPIMIEGHRSTLHFIKAATGGAGLTWRQWLFPLKISELPNAYLLMWVVVVELIAGIGDRWYLGLSWFGIVPSVRGLNLGMFLIVGFVIYFTWLWRASRQLSIAA